MAKVLRADALSKCIGCFTCMSVCAGMNHKNHSIEKSAIRIKTSGGLSGKFVSTVCLACLEPACVEACRTGALSVRKDGGATFNEKKCMGCSHCVRACLVDAIIFDAETNKPIICKHCGVCAKYCPHGCLSMKEVGQ